MKLDSLRPLLVCGAAVFLCGCAHQASRGDQQAEAFTAYSEEFVNELMAANPGWAIAVGRYEFADQLDVPDADSRLADAIFMDRHLAQLSVFDAEALPPLLRADHELIRGFLESQRWQSETLRRWQWNPAQYNVAGGFATLLNTDYAPLEQRLRSVSQRLLRVPAYYQAALANIDTPTREHVELAIQQNQGALSLFDEALFEQVEESALSAGDQLQFRVAVEGARAAIQGYVEALQAMLVDTPASGFRDFRLGGELYPTLFDHQIQSGYSARQLYERALQEKDRLHAQMAEQAQHLWPQLFPDQPAPAERVALIGAVINKLSDKHADIDGFVDEVREQIRELEAFVADKQLLDLDPDKPLVVRETPPYQRGVAIASIDAPGPFDPNANTYYNVTPLDRFSPAQAESFLREYNHWVLQVLNIHEAVPGHYTQLIHANRSPSKIKSLLGNGAMIEGWAVYAERMMLENGWGEQAPEMWLLYGKWNLRVVCNTILDYGVHVLGMSEDEALDLLMREAFQTETEARGKWRRVQLSQVQLTSYFSGYAEIYDFREQRKQALGEAFDLRAFHNQFLSYGSAPVRVIKSLMAPGT